MSFGPPTYNGSPIFSGLQPSGNIFVGTLQVGPYSQSIQTFHFNGENGDRRLPLGWPDRSWVYTGDIIATDMPTMQGIFATIETYVDADPSNPASFQTLVDSNGTSWSNALILMVHPGRWQKYIGAQNHSFFNGVIARGVVITGIISGMQRE